MAAKQKLSSQIVLFFFLLLLTSCQAEVRPAVTPPDNFDLNQTQAKTPAAETPTATRLSATPEVTPPASYDDSRPPTAVQRDSTTTPTPEQAQLVTQLMTNMTLQEKLGQLFAVHFDDPYLSPILEEQITDMHIGGLILFSPNIDRPGQVATLTNQAQQLASRSGAGLPATLSEPILTDLLRAEMGYTGLVATDSLGMGALDQQYGVVRASMMALEAGADLLMFGNDPGHDPLEARAVYEAILAEIERGHISEARVDNSVSRILETKARYGLLEWAAVDVQRIPSMVGTTENLAKAQEISRKTITLIKNDEQLLPLRQEVTLAVISPEGSLAADQFPKEYVTNVTEFSTTFNPTQAEVTQILQTLSTAGLDVVILGTINATNYPGQIQLAAALEDYPMVVIALGLPYDLTVLPNVTTYLATYGYPPPSLAILPDLLWGQTQPAGHLPVSINDQYPIGFGLTSW